MSKRQQTLKPEYAWVAIAKPNVDREQSLTQGYWLARSRRELMRDLERETEPELWKPVRVRIAPAPTQRRTK